MSSSSNGSSSPPPPPPPPPPNLPVSPQSQTETHSPAIQHLTTPLSLTLTCDYFAHLTNTPNTTPQKAHHGPPGNFALVPLARISDGTIFPSFPKTYSQLMHMTESQLDAFAIFYNQYSSSDPLHRKYPRPIQSPFSDVVIATTLGGLAPLSGDLRFPETGNDASIFGEDLVRQFNDAQYSSSERRKAKVSQVAWFLGVQRYWAEGSVRQRAARWVRECCLVLGRCVQVHQGVRVKVRKWNLGGL